MMSSLGRSCLLLLVLLCLPWMSHAQSDAMIAYRNGDLVTWSLSNNVPEQITFWGYNGGGILSPDGSTIAFLSWDGTVGEKIANGDLYVDFGALPGNIWVMDIATQEFRWINDQSGAVSESGIYRSYPVWSPDGTRLAWTELNEYPNTSIQVYDFRTDEITTIAEGFDLGYQDAGLWMPTIKWGDGGISRILFNIVGEDFTGKNTLEVYDPESGALSTVDLTFLDPDGSGFMSHHWVNDGGRDVLTVQVDNRWGKIDPQSGSYTPMTSPPVLQKVGDDTLQLIPAYTGSYSFEWYVNNGGIVTQIGYNSYSIESANLPTISPNGRIVAWNDGTGISIWDTGSQSTQQIIDLDDSITYGTPGPANVAWSPMEWVLSDAPIVIQVRPTDAPTIVPPTQAPQPTAVPQQPANSCKLPARLYTGGYGVLGPGDNNNVRQSWSTNSAVIGEIFPGEIVYVIDGPVCYEGFNWYLVSNEFIYGWTAEGFNGEYWLIPWN